MSENLPPVGVLNRGEAPNLDRPGWSSQPLASHSATIATRKAHRGPDNGAVSPRAACHQYASRTRKDSRGPSTAAIAGCPNHTDDTDPVHPDAPRYAAPA